ISVSTDCVFSGRKGNYSESDEPDARDLYGLSKLLGEVKAGNCLTLRTSMIGRELNSQNSLVEWFLSNRGGRVDGWTKAIYSGFPTLELAKIIGDIIEFSPDLRGMYHVSSDPVSKFDLLQLLDDAYGARVEITPSEKVVIDRSLDSTVFREITGYAPPTWAEMVAAMAADPTPYDEFDT
ncbi:MAG: sugar nucleotide-binding protein, partial [Pyrinomonadaceae bacterium]|nr:sugar nucleotide-binding protein [Pyrinomonadaceae bacterium]